MYKVGDRVRFTFLGIEYIGHILEKVDAVKWKIKCEAHGTIYPFIYGKEPVKKKGVKKVNPLGVIIEKL
jgi:hypothetical protein